jgi:hypothetical protein
LHPIAHRAGLAHGRGHGVCVDADKVLDVGVGQALLPERQAGQTGDGALDSLGALELALGFIDSAADGVDDGDQCCR